jgi:hypothetical protein
MKLLSRTLFDFNENDKFKDGTLGVKVGSGDLSGNFVGSVIYQVIL